MTAKPRMTSATYAVLTTLATLAPEACYGLPIIRETGLPSGTVYPILRRLENHGWVRCEEQAGAAPGLPDRRVYTLTDLGRAELRNAEQNLTPAARVMSILGRTRPAEG